MSLSQVRLTTLKDELLELEEECVEVLQDLLKEFDRNYSELVETNKVSYNEYFTQVWLMLLAFPPMEFDSSASKYLCPAKLKPLLQTTIGL